MKKVLASFMLLLSCAVLFAQGAPTTSATNFPWAEKPSFYITVTDTVSGTSDSVILVPKFEQLPGVFYVFNKYLFLGVDSVKIALRLDKYGRNGTSIVATEVFDTISTQAFESILLPINKTTFGGEQYRVMGKAIANNGSTSIYKGGSVGTIQPANNFNRSDYSK